MKLLTSKLPIFSRLISVVFLLSVVASTVVAQTTAARPDRGVMPNGSYSVSDIEKINMQNGNLNLEIPLASLPPIAGGKLGWTLKAHYNSKLWNINRVELMGERSDFSQVPYVVDTPELSDLGGWRISGQYEIEIRDARSEFDYQLPPVADEPDYSLMNNYNWYKVVLRTPDGAEHELRPVDHSPFGGGRSFMYSYYSASPYTNGTMRYYSFDGSHIYATVTAQNNWTVMLPDGTRVIQTTDGIQRLQDTNGNKIKIFTNATGTHYQDEQTGREIRYLYDPSGNGGKGQGRVYYKTVTGVEKYIAINFDMTTVVGQVYPVKDWIPGQFSQTPCTRHSEINTDVPVISEIILPETEPAVTRKFSFSYNSDSTESAYNPSVRFTCSDPMASYTRTASKGWGALSEMTTPSGAVVNYSYLLDSPSPFGHLPPFTDDIAGESIKTKTLSDSSTTLGVWTYDVNSTTGVTTVTNPDGSTVTEHQYLHSPAFGFTHGKAALVYRSVAPFVRTDRHWIDMPFSGASTTSSGGPVSFNPVVDKEYTTLLDASGNFLKMSAKAFQYDYNGNLLQTTEYDWFDPALVSRDAQGVPTGVPGSATVLRVVNNSYYNPATTSTSGNVYAKRSITTGAPLIVNALKETTVGPAITQLSYDGQAYGVAPTVGNLTSQKVWDDLDSKWITSSQAYGTYGNLVSKTDPRGNVTQFYYDDATHALPTRVVVDPENGTGTQTTTTEFDYSTGLITKQTDADGNFTTINYTNQLLGTVDPFGRAGIVYGPLVNANGVNQKQRTTTTYKDSLRQVIQATDLNTENDQLLKTRTTADALGRIILTEQTENGISYTISSQQVYEQMGKISYSSNPARSAAASTDGWTRATKDTAGRVVEVATFSGTVKPAATGYTNGTGKVTTAYDANFTTVTDQAGKLRRSMVDALGRLVRVDEPNASNSLGTTAAPVQPTTYGYSVLGNLTNVTQGAQIRTFTYDSLSRLRTAVNPESGTVTYQYDDNGNLLSRLDARSITTSFAYDALNRVVSRSYQNDPNSTPTVTYTYDSSSISNGKGRLASVTSSVSSYSYAGYDALGRVSGATQAIGSQSYSLGYTYELSGSVKTITYPSGRTVNHLYDNAGRLSSFTGNLGDGTTRTYANEFEYTSLNGLQQERFGTQTPIYHKQRYNSRGQLWDMRASTVSFSSDPANGDRGAIVNYYSNNFVQGGSGLDNNGNLLRQESYLPGSGFFQDNFAYDELNRLTSIAEKLNGTGSDSFKQTFTYDRWGNRLIDTDPARTWGLGINNKSFSVNATNNRLTVPSGQSGLMTYDAAGNLTTDTYSGSAVTRLYDGENRMTKETQSGSYDAGIYAYDGDGRRVKRKVDGVETWQVYGVGCELLAEYAASAAPSNPQKEYGYRNGQLLVTAEPAARTNVALSANGATATASTILNANFPAAGANNGDRKGTNWGSGGGWADATSGTFPDWLQIDFSGSKTINEIDVFTLQNNYSNPSEPTETMTFSTFGLTGYDVQYWNGSTWVTVTGGSITGNNKVWRKITFSPITTTKIRILTNAAIDNGYSRITEVEAWEAPPPTNFALAANGGVASASTSLSGSFPAGGTNNGDRKGTNWGSGGGWADATSGSFPDSLEIEFNASKTINEIDVFTLQNNYSSPSEPTESMTFSTYGLSGYDVQYWNGSTWVTVTGGSITGNNKVWRKITFSPITTSKIRVRTNAAVDNGYSRITELEAWGTPVEGSAEASINWLVTDHLGTPRIIADQTGSLAGIKRHDYLPFGEELLAGTGGRTLPNGYSGDNVRQKFTQKERDNETGLDFFEARYYASSQGRFTSPDEFTGGPEELYYFADDASANPTFYSDLRKPQSLNKYQYAYNNPLRWIDPDGHEPDDPQKKKKEDIDVVVIKTVDPKIVSFDVKLIDKVPNTGEVPVGGEFEIKYKYVVNEPTDGSKPEDAGSIGPITPKGTFTESNQVGLVNSTVKVDREKEAVAVEKTERYVVNERRESKPGATAAINFKVVVKDPNTGKVVERRSTEGRGDKYIPVRNVPKEPRRNRN